MTRAAPQRTSLLPIGRALSILDDVTAGERHIRWDVKGVRTRLGEAAIDGFIETGTAKRILHSGEPENTLPYGSIAGIDRIIQLWNGLKTISQQARKDEMIRWRRGLDAVIMKTLSDGLVAVRYVSHPHFSPRTSLDEHKVRAIGLLADAMHNLPDMLSQKKHVLIDIHIGEVKRDLAAAGRMIAAIRSW